MRRCAWIAVFAALAPWSCLAPRPCMAADKTESAPAATGATPSAASADSAVLALPDAPPLPFALPAAAFHVAALPASAVRSARHSVSFAPVTTAVISPLYSMPLVPAAMRLGGHNFNTNDGSSMDAFAICYRLNRRSSVQVIPGDPAPVKLPVATMANNMGVTVGMVYRLSRQH